MRDVEPSEHLACSTGALSQVCFKGKALDSEFACNRPRFFHRRPREANGKGNGRRNCTKVVSNSLAADLLLKQVNCKPKQKI